MAGLEANARVALAGPSVHETSPDEEMQEEL